MKNIVKKLWSKILFWVGFVIIALSNIIVLFKAPTVVYPAFSIINIISAVVLLIIWKRRK